jgi:hypothetical protein
MTMARLHLLLLVLAAIATSVSASSLLGRITGDVYVSPRALFEVNVPTMRNPFVKKPQSIRDERTPDGGEEVTFSVLDLGESWRYGVTPAPSGANVEPSATREISDKLLVRWLGTPANPNAIYEEQVQLTDGSGALLIYEQEGASLLFKKSGSTVEREVALIGVVVARSEAKALTLYVVGQFDMPMDMLRFHVETRKVPREKVIARFAREHAKRLQELAASFRLR